MKQLSTSHRFSKKIMQTLGGYSDLLTHTETSHFLKVPPTPEGNSIKDLEIIKGEFENTQGYLAVGG